MEWISVKDKLPDENVHVLTIDHWRDYDFNIAHISIEMDKKVWRDQYEHELDHVTHWLPLPPIKFIVDK